MTAFSPKLPPGVSERDAAILRKRLKRLLRRKRSRVAQAARRKPWLIL